MTRPVALSTTAGCLTAGVGVGHGRGEDMSGSTGGFTTVIGRGYVEWAWVSEKPTGSTRSVEWGPWKSRGEGLSKARLFPGMAEGKVLASRQVLAWVTPADVSRKASSGVAS